MSGGIALSSPIRAGLSSGQVHRPGARDFLFKKLILAEFHAACSRAYSGIEIPAKLSIEKPKQKEYGEYAIATFQLSKVLRQVPQQIAQTLMAEMAKSERLLEYFDLSVVGGYINFKFSDTFLRRETPLVDRDLGRNTQMKGKKVLVEYVSANPTGPLHIGHGRWAVLGDSICRLFETAGAAVEREFYVNDAGKQIERFRGSVEAARTGQLIPEDGYHGDYIKDLAAQEGDPVQLMIAHQHATLASIGVHFDRWFSEQTLHDQNKLQEAMRILEAAGLTYRAEIGNVAEEEDEPNAVRDETKGEALWFRSTQFGDSKDRVLMRANGIPTYFAADVAYHLDKVRRGYDLLINIFGADHHGYVARISAAIQALSNQQQDHQVIIGQLVKLIQDGQEVRMSKRKGTALMLNDLIDEIGPDAVRVFMASTGFDAALSIDLNKALEQSDKNPVYYLQYAHARASQVLKLAQERGFIPSDSIAESYQFAPEERGLLTHLFQFPDEVWDGAEQRNVHKILKYSGDLAGRFNLFYSQCRIIDADQPEMTGVRLAMAKAVRQVLANSFQLLGISAPEEMKREAHQ